MMMSISHGELETHEATTYQRSMMMMHYPGPGSRMPFFSGKPGAWFITVEWTEAARTQEGLWADKKAQKIKDGGRTVYDTTTSWEAIQATMTEANMTHS